MSSTIDIVAALPGLAAALGSGLLIGLERERRHAGSAKSAPAGVRTFALVTLSGAVCELLGPLLLAVGASFVALAALAVFLQGARDVQLQEQQDNGLTTEIALLLAFLLGVMAMRAPMLAGALAVVVAVLLASKTRLHDFIHRTLTDSEVKDGLTLAAAAIVVLPLLPSEPVDPWGVLNLRKLWLLVVLVMAINAAGYIALRAFGSHVGLAITGFTGGFVSSTATIASMGVRARESPQLLAATVSGALMSNVATLIQLTLILVAMAPALLRQMAVALAISGGFTVLAAVLASVRSFRQHRRAAPSSTGLASPLETPAVAGRPFRLSHALAFAGVVALVMLIAAALNAWLGSTGVLVAAAITGFTDAHAPAASVAQLYSAQSLSMNYAELAILLGVSSNTLTKIVVAGSSGGRGFALRLLPGLLLMLVGLLVPWLIANASG